MRILVIYGATSIVTTMRRSFMWRSHLNNIVSSIYNYCHLCIESFFFPDKMTKFPYLEGNLAGCTSIISSDWILKSATQLKNFVKVGNKSSYNQSSLKLKFRLYVGGMTESRRVVISVNIFYIWGVLTPKMLDFLRQNGIGKNRSKLTDEKRIPEFDIFLEFNSSIACVFRG